MRGKSTLYSTPIETKLFNCLKDLGTKALMYLLDSYLIYGKIIIYNLNLFSLQVLIFKFTVTAFHKKNKILRSEPWGPHKEMGYVFALNRALLLNQPLLIYTSSPDQLVIANLC